MRVQQSSLVSDISPEAIRFLITGGAVSLISATTYYVFVTYSPVSPVIANFISFAVHVCLGFVANRSWTFREQVSRSEGKRTSHRYVTVCLLALCMNTAWTALLTGPLGLPDWSPLAPMLLVTPLCTFQLNKRWVF